MDKLKLNFEFHNPNTEQSFSDFLVKFLPEITYESKVFENHLSQESEK